MMGRLGIYADPSTRMSLIQTAPAWRCVTVRGPVLGVWGVLLLALGVALIVLLPDNTQAETIGGLCISAAFLCFCFAGCWGGCCGGWNRTEVHVHQHGESKTPLIIGGGVWPLATHRDGGGGWVYRDET